VPYRGFKRKLTVGYLAPTVAAMALLAAIVMWRIDRQTASTRWVEHSDQVLLHSKDAELEMQAMMLASRGYLLTTDTQFLTKRTDAERHVDKELGEIAALVGDNPSQERRLVKIRDLKASWIRTADRLIGEKEGRQLDKEAIAESDNQASGIFAALQDFAAAESRLREERMANQIRNRRLAFVLVPVLVVAVMIFLSYWGRHQILSASEEFRDALRAADEARAAAEEARTRAERANFAKDNFLATVSHELRNPLNSILLWSAALIKRDADNRNVSGMRRGLTAIEQAARVQAQLIEDLLDISRIESGRLRLDVQTIDLAEVVHAGVESVRLAADAKGIKLQELAEPRINFVSGDPGRLQQVVWNLASNAVKFTPSGGRIQVQVERINSHVEIVVEDNGEGIDPASLGSVFDRFWQVDELRRTGQGVGLGLSIVKEIVNLHGGTIVAHSEGRGKGATFTVRLPLPVNKTAATELRGRPVASLTNAATAPRLDGAAILVVDDDAEACEALKKLLESLGATATTLTSAQKALELLDTLHPDAIVSDIRMPLQDGYFLAREIRRREQNTPVRRRVPLVALTAYGRVEDRVEILTAGFDSHTIKPVETAELATILRSLINTRGGELRA
jgi:signal transduction histidine kinase/CheY-like chemotaxis protein